MSARHPRAKAFIIGFDRHDSPITKPIADMTRDDMDCALAWAADEYCDALEAVEPYIPLVEANYLPDDINMAQLLVDKVLAVETVRLRLLQLCEAVLTLGVH